ncbi:hypothetical protein [Clostridium estertheticum]|uniref:hypothetical protein n=1 Tax=Clostridium estertheticum TaxID=238834 RepID=UPI001C0DBD81|nr:hypothetical protein [Clostridium estertheticum]MBU3186583.1 hypothetical protein [Clostridium estertheticum]
MMTEEDLTRANEIKKELRELDSFIFSAGHVWTGKIIKRDTKYIFKSNGYGVIDSAEFSLSTSMKDKVLDVLRAYQSDLMEQLASL